MALLLFAAIALTGCNQQQTPPASETPPAAEEQSPSEAPQAEETTPTEDKFPGEVEDATELETEDITEGSGAEAQDGSIVSVHYTGWLKDGTKFDSSRDRGQPFQFRLGEGMVIAGWEEGVKGMKVGGKRILVIPPDMGYGEAGSPPVIPPNSTLVFTVELLDVQ
jgi:FKBP-type peptidyl-prolyl cis-trans isomerase